MLQFIIMKIRNIKVLFHTNLNLFLFGFHVTERHKVVHICETDVRIYIASLLLHLEILHMRTALEGKYQSNNYFPHCKSRAKLYVSMSTCDPVKEGRVLDLGRKRGDALPQHRVAGGGVFEFLQGSN